jgi:hypothetical protein
MALPQVYAPTAWDNLKATAAIPFKIIGWLVLAALLSELIGGLAGSFALGMLVFLGILGFAARKPLIGLFRSNAPALPEPSAPPPPPREALILGKTLLDDGGVEPLAIPEELRSRHCYLIGKSGTGKMTLVSNMIVHDMKRGNGLAFLDPHGDAAQNLLRCIPQERLNDVIYYNPMARMAPAFNPLRLPYDPAKLAADMLSVFQTFSGESWESAPRMQHVLRNAFTLLITDSKPHETS